MSPFASFAGDCGAYPNVLSCLGHCAKRIVDERSYSISKGVTRAASTGVHTCAASTGVHMLTYIIVESIDSSDNSQQQR